MTDTVAILKRARELVERGWVKGQLAVDDMGVSASVWQARATCFCSVGAIQRAIWEQPGWDGVNPILHHEYHPALEALCADLPEFSSIVEFNDDNATAKDDVIALFDRAIATQEKVK